jgi:uncharacterized protein
VDHRIDKVKDSIDILRKKWKVEQAIYDLHIGKRDDVTDFPILVGDVIFHIPKLNTDQLFVLWDCLWPDCHNCCERQGRLPLTKDDILAISSKLGYTSAHDFVKNETRVSNWEESGIGGNIITTLSMISLKRKADEEEKEDGLPIKCRFLDPQGSCNLHPDKPGVCWLYPFASWMESDGIKPSVHASFQFTGDCPGFYTAKSIDPMSNVLKEYSKKIYDYNMAVNRTTREKYGSVNFVHRL